MIEPAASRKDSWRRWIGVAGCISLLVVVIFQWVSNSRLREENESLRRQRLAADSKPVNAQVLLGAAEAIDTDQSQRDKFELLQLRDELQRFRQQASAPGAPARPGSSPPAPVVAPVGQPPADEARQLALAAMQGNPSALNRLASLVAAMRTMNPDEQVAMRSSIGSAFEMLGTEAGTGNTGSLRALWQASRIAELKGYAVKGLGQAAGLGNEEALEPQLEPEKYLLLRSSATSALKPAADAGNDRAIQALAATAADPKQEGLWLLAAQGLEKAAAAGDAMAIDSLATLAAVQNEVIRKQAVFALEAAARENQPRAEEALRMLGWR
jgi:hypothetical protein